MYRYLLVLLGFSLLAQAELIPLQPATPSAILELDRPQPSRAWLAFHKEHSDWRIADWDHLRPYPHRAHGRLALGQEALRDEYSLDQRLRSLMRKHAGLFPHPDELKLEYAQKHGAVWYIRYGQVLNGLSVIGAPTEFRVHENGNLVLFGSDALPAVDIPRAALDRQNLQGILQRLVEHSIPGARVGMEEAPALLPVYRNGALRPEPVFGARITGADAREHWRVYLSAIDGALVQAWNRVRHVLVEGQIDCLVEPEAPWQSPVPWPLAHAQIHVDGVPGLCDAEGQFAIEVPGGGPWTLSGIMAGAFASVNRVDGPSSTFSRTITASGESFVIGQEDALIEERDAYLHTDAAYRFVKGLDPSFTGLDTPLPVNINIDNFCDAFWDGSSINFYLEGNDCPNTARVPGIVYHEYGHAVNDRQYEQAGVQGGMANGTLHEGLSDVLTAMMMDVSGIAPGWFLRDLQNSLVYPQDITNQVHHDGTILGGALWDLRQAIGLEAVSLLHHMARWGTPDDWDTGRAFFDYYQELLVADDDNGDLSDGTPRFNEIDAAFNAHGIGSVLSWIGLDFRFPEPELFLPPGQNAEIRIHLEAPASLPQTSVSLHYVFEGEEEQSVDMQPQGAGLWIASLPGRPEGQQVEYYAVLHSASDSLFHAPGGAPETVLHSYFREVTPQIMDFESGDGGGIGEGSWAWGAVTAGPDSAASGDLCWGTDLDADYPSAVWEGLEFPARTVSAEWGAALGLSHWRRLQEGDGVNLEVSVNGGEFLPLPPMTGYDFTTDGLNVRPEQPAWSGLAPSWRRAWFDLSGVVSQGSTVALRFNLMTTEQDSDAGWFLDDLAWVGFEPETLMEHDPLPDSQDSGQESFLVLASLPEDITPETFTLSWRAGGGPIQESAMFMDQQPGQWQGTIAGPFDNQLVEYRLDAWWEEEHAGHPANLDEWHSFFVGEDLLPPQVEFLQAPFDVIGPSASFRVRALATDASSIEQVFLDWRVPGGEWEFWGLQGSGNGEWQGLVYLHEPTGSVECRLRAVDASPAHNVGTSEELEIQLGGYQRVDRFSDPALADWQLEGDWAVQGSLVYDGDYALGTGIEEGPPAFADWSARWNGRLDLEYVEAARLRFAVHHEFVRDDRVLLELSPDGQDWTEIFDLHDISANWQVYTLDLEDWLGEPSVELRFRMLADSMGGNGNGFAVDAIEVLGPDTEIAPSRVLPVEPSLRAWPNPFNPVTRIAFSLPAASAVRLDLYSLDGALVHRLAEGRLAAGRHQAVLDGSGLAAGVYICSLRAGDKRRSIRLLLLK